VTTEPTTEQSTSAPAADRPAVPEYEIRVEGHLGDRWEAWFDGLRLVAEEGGTTVIVGPVADQAALHGLLQKLRDLGIPLVSLTQVSPIATTTTRITSTTTTTTTPGPTLRRHEGN